MKRILRIIILVFCLAAAAYAGYQLLSSYLEYRQSDKTYEGLEGYAGLRQTEASGAGAGNEPGIYRGPAMQMPAVDYAGLEKINSDIIGWIYLPDSPVNYPVVKSSDNYYYTKHLYDKTANFAGAIFLCYLNRTDFSDKHSIIYGHHLKNGKMFACLMDYKDQAYFEAHPRVALSTRDADYVIEIFAANYCGENGYMWSVSYGSEAEYREWLSRLIGESVIKSDIVPDIRENVVSLATCNYDGNGQRFTVTGVLRKVVK